MRWMLLGIGILLMTGVGFASAQDDLPALAHLPVGTWTQIAAGAETRCLYGADFSFFVRPSQQPSAPLVIYFEGGGACWDGATCGARGQFAARYAVADDWAASYTQGIFAFDHPDNPIADAHLIFIPYCSGDLHNGDATQTFALADGSALTVYFNGFDNAAATLAWVYANFPAPAQIIVAGTSAGGYGATTHAAFVMQQYPTTPVVLLSDAATGVIPDGWSGRTTWKVSANAARFLPGLADVTDDTFTVTRQMIALGQAFPDNRLAQYNNYLDVVQIGFYALTAGTSSNFQQASAAWTAGLVDNLAAISDALPNFAHYTAGGFQHTILADDSFYSAAVNGVVFRDWFSALIAGTAPQSVVCAAAACFQTP